MIPVRTYGSWSSPITAEVVVAGAVGLGEVVVDGDDVWWAESRPDEGGRTVVVRRSSDGSVADMVPAGVDVRTGVHEYGGGGLVGGRWGARPLGPVRRAPLPAGR